MYRDCKAFRSPEFETLTYSHITRGGESDVYERLRDEGGFLVFFSTLFYLDEIPPAIEGISGDRGAYIIGYFKVEGVYTDMEVVTDAKLQARFKANGARAKESLNYFLRHFILLGVPIFKPNTMNSTLPIEFHNFLMNGSRTSYALIGTVTVNGTVAGKKKPNRDKTAQG